MLLLTACAGGGGATAERLEQAAGTAVEVAGGDDAPDVSTIPEDADDIDVTYVQAVMDALNVVDLAAFEVLAESGDAHDREFVPLLASTRTPELLHAHLQGIERHGVDRAPDPPEAPTTEVLEVGSASLGCVHVLADHVTSPLLDEAVTPAQQPHAIVLIPGPGDAAANPTAWVMARVSSSDLDDPCPS